MERCSGMIRTMTDEGIGAPKDDDEGVGPPPPAGGPRPLEGPGSEERLRELQARFRGQQRERMPTLQLVLIGLFIFLVILIFGAGKSVIADLAPKLPPGMDINAPSPR
jgi:hypothetical protein